MHTRRSRNVPDGKGTVEREKRTRRQDGGGENSRGISLRGKNFTGLAHCAGFGARYRAAARPPTGTRLTEFLYVYPPARVTVRAVERRRAALNRARALRLFPALTPRPAFAIVATRAPSNDLATCMHVAIFSQPPSPHPTTPCRTTAAVYRTIAPTLPVANRRVVVPNTVYAGL